MGNQTFCGILMQNGESPTIIKTPKTQMQLHYNESNILWLTHPLYLNLTEIQTFKSTESSVKDENKISLEINNPSFYFEENCRKELVSILNSNEEIEKRQEIN